jgi:hypothetical protein
MLGRWYVAALAVSLALVIACLLAGSASAAEPTDTTHPVEFRPGGSITSRGTLTYNVGAARITCNVSLSGSFTSGTMEFMLGEALGSASSVSAESCRGGTVTLQAEARAPWHIWVHEPLGTLPEAVTGSTIWFTPATMLVRAESISSCRYPAARIGGLLGMRFVEGSRWTYRSGSITMSTSEDEWGEPVKLEGVFECPTEPTVSGTLSLTTEEMTAQNPLGFNFSPSNHRIVYTTSGSHRITFTNRTMGAIGPLSPSVIVYSPSRGFSITPMRDLCNGATPAMITGTCDVEVTYNAATAAEPWTNLLQIKLGMSVEGFTWVMARPK